MSIGTFPFLPRRGCATQGDRPCRTDQCNVFLDKGWHLQRTQLHEVVLYIRKGKLLPIGKEISNTRDYDVDTLRLLGDGDTYHLYTDDGLTHGCTMDDVRVLRK